MIPHDELTIPEAAEAMQLSEPEVLRLIHLGLLHSRQASGRAVIAAAEVRRYWYETAAAESAATVARMNAEDDRLGREAEERTLNRALRSTPLPFVVRPAGCMVSLLVLATMRAVARLRLKALGYAEESPVHGAASLRTHSS